MQNTHSDILILGAGPSGLSAAISCKLNNPEMRVIVIEKSHPYNKIGCVIREDTIGYLDELDVDANEIGQVYQFDTNKIMSIDRCKFEVAMLSKAKSLGVDIIQDYVCSIEGESGAVKKVISKRHGSFSAFHYVDATGQVSLIPRFFGLRKRSGSGFTAIYTHFESDDYIEAVKNMLTPRGFLWVIPLPPSEKTGKYRYQLLKVLKEDSETLTHVNLFRSTPALKDLGLSESIKFIDPCNKFGEYVRQYPPFIYDNESSIGVNWTALGDSDSTYFDRIFLGIDKAILDGLKSGESLSEL